jgi:N-carbamoyl-L-amino-acid hydrolase
MLTYAAAVLAARELALDSGQRATMGRVEVEPGSTNSIPSRVTAWLDARAESGAELDALVAGIIDRAETAAREDGTTVEVRAESITGAVEFDAALQHRLAALLDAPVLPTGAGHDAGILGAILPTAMLFVRNPTGISHAPQESAAPEDIDAGVTALARVVRELA